MATTPVKFIGYEGSVYDVALYATNPDSDTAVFTAASIAGYTNRKTVFGFNVTSALSGIYWFVGTNEVTENVEATGYVWLSDDTDPKYVCDTYAAALSLQTASVPALPVLTASAETINVVTGDNLTLPIDIVDGDGDPIPISILATVRASFRYKRNIISPIVTCAPGASGADWPNGRVIVIMSSTQSGQIELDQERVVASLEVEIDDSGKTTVFADNFIVREGLLV